MGSLLFIKLWEWLCFGIKVTCCWVSDTLTGVIIMVVFAGMNDG